MMNFNKMRQSVIGLSIVAAVAVVGFGGTMAFAASNIVIATNTGVVASWYEPYKSFMAAERIYVNGEPVKDFPAFYTRSVQIGGIFEENIYVPLRAVAEKLGIEVTWNKKAKAATVGSIEIKQGTLPEGYKGLSPQIFGNYLYVAPSLFTELFSKELDLTYEGIVTEMFGTDLALSGSTAATDASEQSADSMNLTENNGEQGSDASVEDERLMMALATNIEKGLLSFENIDKAAVALTLGSNDPFFIGNSTTTVFVVLTISKNIEKEQITAIANYISKSVNSLSIENIRIADQNGNIIFPEISE